MKNTDLRKVEFTYQPSYNPFMSALDLFSQNTEEILADTDFVASNNSSISNGGTQNIFEMIKEREKKTEKTGNGFFHSWINIEQAPKEKMHALVEMEDGSMIYIKAQNLKFIS